MYISREKYIASFKNYDKHFEETKTEAIRSLQQTILEQKQQSLK